MSTNEQLVAITETAEQFKSFHKVDTTFFENNIRGTYVLVEFLNRDDAFEFFDAVLEDQNIRLSSQWYARYNNPAYRDFPVYGCEVRLDSKFSK